MSKKQMIVDSAIELFALRGIEATSVQQITAHCGISKGAFYLSFKSKDELILAIIDFFMQNTIKEIDQSVSNIKDPQKKLFFYYVTTFEIIKRSARFAEIFIKEPLQSISEEFFEKVMFYENVSNNRLLALLDDLYGKSVAETKYDLMIIIKGFIKSYGQIICGIKTDLDLNKLAKTLVEKTNVLARYSTDVLFTEQHIQMFTAMGTVTKQQILTELEAIEMDHFDEVERDSLQLLQEQLETDEPRFAIVNGMLANLKTNPGCSWLCFLVGVYMEKEK